MEIQRWNRFWCQLPGLATVHRPQKRRERWISDGSFSGIMEMRAQSMTNWSWIKMTHTACIATTLHLFSQCCNRYWQKMTPENVQTQAFQHSHLEPPHITSSFVKIMIPTQKTNVIYNFICLYPLECLPPISYGTLNQNKWNLAHHEVW